MATCGRAIEVSDSLFVVVLGLLMLLSACQTSAPERGFAAQDLLIDEGVVPPGWSLYKGPTDILANEGQAAGAFITFHTDAPVIVRAGENVYQYASRRKAARHYARFERDYFNDDSVYNLTPWELPAELPYGSSVANQSRFGCAEKSFGYRSTICGFLGQYEEFLVFSTATVAAEGEQYMTMAELEPILRAIDQKMADQGLGQEQ